MSSEDEQHELEEPPAGFDTWPEWLQLAVAHARGHPEWLRTGFAPEWATYAGAARSLGWLSPVGLWPSYLYGMGELTYRQFGPTGEPWTFRGREAQTMGRALDYLQAGAWGGPRADYYMMQANLWGARGAYWQARQEFYPQQMGWQAVRLVSYTIGGSAMIRAFGFPFWGAYQQMTYGAAMMPYVRAAYEADPTGTMARVTTSPSFWPYQYPSTAEQVVSSIGEWTLAQTGFWALMGGLRGVVPYQVAAPTQMIRLGFWRSAAATTLNVAGWGFMQAGLQLMVEPLSTMMNRRMAGLPLFATQEEQNAVMMQEALGGGMFAGGVALSHYAPIIAARAGLTTTMRMLEQAPALIPRIMPRLTQWGPAGAEGIGLAGRIIQPLMYAETLRMAWNLATQVTTYGVWEAAQQLGAGSEALLSLQRLIPAQRVSDQRINIERLFGLDLGIQAVQPMNFLELLRYALGGAAQARQGLAQDPRYLTGYEATYGLYGWDPRYRIAQPDIVGPYQPTGAGYWGRGMRVPPDVRTGPYTPARYGYGAGAFGTDLWPTNWYLPRGGVSAIPGWMFYAPGNVRWAAEREDWWREGWPIGMGRYGPRYYSRRELGVMAIMGVPDAAEDWTRLKIPAWYDMTEMQRQALAIMGAYTGPWQWLKPYEPEDLTYREKMARSIMTGAYVYTGPFEPYRPSARRIQAWMQAGWSWGPSGEVVREPLETFRRVGGYAGWVSQQRQFGRPESALEYEDYLRETKRESWMTEYRRRLLAWQNAPESMRAPWQPFRRTYRGRVYEIGPEGISLVGGGAGARAGYRRESWEDWVNRAFTWSADVRERLYGMPESLRYRKWSPEVRDWIFRGYWSAEPQGNVYQQFQYAPWIESWQQYMEQARPGEQLPWMPEKRETVEGRTIREYIEEHGGRAGLVGPGGFRGTWQQYMEKMRPTEVFPWMKGPVETPEQNVIREYREAHPGAQVGLTRPYEGPATWQKYMEQTRPTEISPWMEPKKETPEERMLREYQAIHGGQVGIMREAEPYREPSDWVQLKTGGWKYVGPGQQQPGLFGGGGYTTGGGGYATGWNWFWDWWDRYQKGLQESYEAYGNVGFNRPGYAWMNAWLPDIHAYLDSILPSMFEEEVLRLASGSLLEVIGEGLWRRISERG